MTFRWISVFAFLIVLGGIGLHALLFPFSASGRWRFMDILRTKIHAFTLLFLDQNLNWIGRLKKLVLLLALLSFFVLLVTGFGPLLFGCRLSGWLLMIHATFAPVLIGCTALLALGWAQGMVFREQTGNSVHEECGCLAGGRKICFWSLIFLSLPLTLSMILSMFKFFGTEGQAFLFVLHRWCALAFACIAIIFFYLLVRRQIEKENAQETIR